MIRVIANLACVKEVNFCDKFDNIITTKEIEDIIFYKTLPKFEDKSKNIYTKGQSIFGFDCRTLDNIYENVILEGILEVPIMILQSYGNDIYQYKDVNVGIDKNDIIYIVMISADSDEINLIEVGKIKGLFELYEKGKFNIKTPFYIKLNKGFYELNLRLLSYSKTINL